jgi:hypothetical protein
MLGAKLSWAVFMALRSIMPSPAAPLLLKGSSVQAGDVSERVKSCQPGPALTLMEGEFQSSPSPPATGTAAVPASRNCRMRLRATSLLRAI